MTSQQAIVSKKIFFCFILFLLVLMSASVTHAETYTFVTKWGSYDSGGVLYPILDPYGIAVDSSGNVYVADKNNHRIQKFDSNGTYITKWGSLGNGNGSFNYPEGVAVDSSGYVYVAERNNHRIQKFDSNGTYITKWGSGGNGNGSFLRPNGIAVDSSG
ncbi:MAG: 6-bladed beta-propeller, partial [Alphaproteobacteria bacterium]